MPLQIAPRVSDKAVSNPLQMQKEASEYMAQVREFPATQLATDDFNSLLYQFEALQLAFLHGGEFYPKSSFFHPRSLYLRDIPNSTPGFFGYGLEEGRGANRSGFSHASMF